MANVIFEKKAKKKPLFEQYIIKKEENMNWVFHWEIEKINGKRIKNLKSVLNIIGGPTEFQISLSEENVRSKMPKYFDKFDFKLVGAELLSSFVSRFNNLGQWKKFLLKLERVFFKFF